MNDLRISAPSARTLAVAALVCGVTLSAVAFAVTGSEVALLSAAGLALLFFAPILLANARSRDALRKVAEDLEGKGG